MRHAGAGGAQSSPSGAVGGDDAVAAGACSLEEGAHIAGAGTLQCP